MSRIEEIFELIDWNNSRAEQAEGIRLAKEVKDIRAFLQPCGQAHDKNVWDNCAVILSERSDEELSPYLVELLEWLQDLNWPGALCILDRLKGMVNEQGFQHAYTICLKRAKALDVEVWENNLKMLKADN